MARVPPAAAHAIIAGTRARANGPSGKSIAECEHGVPQRIDALGVSKDLKGHPSVSALDTTKSTAVKGTVKVFRDTKLGTYTLRACADYAEVVAEIAEDNDCAMATGTIKVTPAVTVP